MIIINRFTGVAISVIYLLCASSNLAQAKQLTVAEKDLERLIELQLGEFNNYNQINFQTNDFIKDKQVTSYSRLHHLKQLIESPDLQGKWVYAHIKKVDRDGELYRQSINHFYINSNDQIISKAFWLKEAPKDKRALEVTFLKRLTLEQLSQKLNEGCETIWQRKLDQFIGFTDHETCVIDSKYKREKRYIFAEEIVGRSGFWGREGGYTQDGKLAFGLEAPNYYRYLRSRPMTCWVAVHLGDDSWEFYRNLNTHDQGGSLEFGEEKQYRIQLKQTKFPASNYSDVFELFVYRGKEEKAFAYTWTEPSAKHIAVNLREVQASCKVSAK